MPDAHLLLDRVTVAGRERPVLNGLSLALPRGQTLALLGPQGAGKTAALLTIAGFLRQSLGTLKLAGRDITAALPENRDIAMVFAEDALFPHLSVVDNVAFGLKMRGRARAERRQAATGTLEALGLGGLADTNPGHLDAPKRRLVALARAIACRPALLLVDEPSTTGEALRDILHGEHVTTILATHDRAAAFGLADLVALLRDGALEQLDTPKNLFDRPATRFAAEFTGPCNLLPATLLGHAAGGAVLKMSGGTANAQARPDLPAGRVLLCLRPHQVRLDQTGPLRGTVERIDYQGALTRLTLRLPEGALAADLAQAPAGLAPGVALTLGWAADDAWLLGDG
jgi:ABC-type Fe3+/spermidine/putrescine transport system ATPase subunit